MIHLSMIVMHTLLGLFFGYIVATLIESIVHQKVSDAPAKSVKQWNRHPLIFKPFIQANYSHHTIHHIKTFRGNYVEQFRNEAEREKLDA